MVRVAFSYPQDPKQGLEMQASIFWGQQGLHLKGVKEDILHIYPKAINASSY